MFLSGRKYEAFPHCSKTCYLIRPIGFRPQFFPAKSYAIGRWHWVKCLHLSLYAKCKHLSVGLYACTVVSLLSPLSLKFNVLIFNLCFKNFQEGIISFCLACLRTLEGALMIFKHFLKTSCKHNDERQLLVSALELLRECGRTAIQSCSIQVF